MDEESNDAKKNGVKNSFSVHASTMSTGSRKTIDKRQLPNLPTSMNGAKELHGASPFTRQVVNETRIPQVVQKTKSCSGVSANKVVFSNAQVTNVLTDMKKMIDKALKARLYFLQQTGPHQFLIGGDSLDHKYRVTIGSQKCSCGKDGLCVHILFVMLRVFQVSMTDPILAKRSLKNFEVETLLRNFSARRRLKIKSASRSPVIKKDSLKSSNSDVVDGNSANVLHPCAQSDREVENIGLGNDGSDEETCPICLLELVEGESLTECKNCQNKYHQHCIDIWSKECSQQKELVVCPLCRASWSPNRSCTDQESNNIQVPTSSTNTFLNELPPDLRNVVSEWLKIFNGNIVQKLISKNWTEREIGLRHLLEEVLSLRVTEEYHESCSLVTFESAICILSHMALDPVYKVFVAVLRVFRNILSCTLCLNESQQSRLRFILEPFIKSIFVKCSDSNKKTGQLAISTLEEFIKGQEGELAVGKDLINSPNLPLGLGDLDYIFSLILNASDSNLPGAEEWQLVYGKLAVLERFVALFPDAFLFSDFNPSNSCETSASAAKNESCYPFHLLECYPNNLHVKNKHLFLDFSLKQLPHSNARIRKASLNILLCIAKLNARKSDTLFHHVLSHINSSTLLDSSSKELLLSKLFKIEEEIKAQAISVNLERVGQSKSRPSSGRGGSWFSRSGSFKSSGYGRAVKSSTSSPVHDFLTGRDLLQRRGHLKKNLSISDDSVFLKSADSGGHATLVDMLFVRKEVEGAILSLCRCFSEVHISPWVQTKRRTSLGKEIKFKDAATSTSPSSGSSSNPVKFTPPGGSKEELSKRSTSDGGGDRLKDRPGSAIGPEKVSFKSEVATTPHWSPLGTHDERYFCKEEVDKEEAEALARALDISDMHQDALPFVPGLSTSDPHSMSQSLLEELKETKITSTSVTESGNLIDGMSSPKSPATTYEENTHWKKGPIIGSGAACTCYQARDIKSGTLMAVKLISFCRNTVHEQDKVKRLIVEEVHTLDQLNHPNIVRMLGATLQSTHVLMFFEWMPGSSVSSLLELYGPFSEMVVIKYTIQILRGLLYLHDNHILHRDLKGANILVDSTGQKIRIGDFGTSARLSSAQTLQGEFQGQLLGTVAFMAPEVLRGSDYGRSCDIWSLGCCIIEMLTGSPPWIAKNISNHLALMFKIASSDRPPALPEVSNHALKDFLLRCLDVNPSERPFAKDLLKHPLFRI